MQATTKWSLMTNCQLYVFAGKVHFGEMSVMLTFEHKTSVSCGPGNE